MHQVDQKPIVRIVKRKEKVLRKTGKPGIRHRRYFLCWKTTKEDCIATLKTLSIKWNIELERDDTLYVEFPGSYTETQLEQKLNNPNIQVIPKRDQGIFESELTKTEKEVLISSKIERDETNLDPTPTKIVKTENDSNTHINLKKDHKIQAREPRESDNVKQIISRFEEAVKNITSKDSNPLDENKTDTKVIPKKLLKVHIIEPKEREKEQSIASKNDENEKSIAFNESDTFNQRKESYKEFIGQHEDLSDIFFERNNLSLSASPIGQEMITLLSSLSMKRINAADISNVLIVNGRFALLNYFFVNIRRISAFAKIMLNITIEHNTQEVMKERLEQSKVFEGMDDSWMKSSLQRFLEMKALERNFKSKNGLS